MITNLKKVLVTLLACALLLGGCTSKPAESSVAEPNAEVKTATATVAGFGGDVTVTLTTTDGELTAVEAVGEKETESVGGAAIPVIVEAMLEAKSVEVDGVAGATFTSEAVLKAAKKAWNELNGIEEETSSVKMAAGTYTAEGTGFAYVEKVPVTVTVDETSIVDVQVSEECSETTIMLRSAVKEVVPAILEHQSVKVDAAVGATLSSNAIKQGVEECLKQALAAAGTDASAIEAFYTVPAKAHEGEQVTLDCDVVVVGLGGAGTNAFVSAAEQGLKVVGIEAADKVGGTSVVTSAPMSVNPEKYIEEYNNGEELVDKAAMREAWLAYTTGPDGVQDAKVEVVDVMLDQSGPALDWLVFEHGLTFGEPHGGMTAADKWIVVFDYIQKSMVPNDRRIAVQDFYNKVVEEAVANNGAELYLGTKGTELIMNDGVVTGVKAVAKDGTEYTVNAKAVVLSTGGFGGNNKMVDKYVTQNEYYDFSNKGGWRLYGCYQNDGTMLADAIAKGAATYNIDMPPMVHNTATPKIMTSMEVLPAEGNEPITGRPATHSLNDVPQIMSDSANILAVGNNGKRFVDEAMMGVLGSWGNGNQFYAIWSTTQIEGIKENGFTQAKVSRYLGQGGWPLNEPVAEIYEAIDKAIELGIAYKADTLEELAGKIGVPAEALVQTVADYNSYCEAGEDTEFHKNPDFLEAIGEGPYYCFVGAPWCYATCGGLDINEYCNVLDTNGNEIVGLYACGEDSLGTMMTNEKAYVTYGGAAQGWAVTSGYYVGKVLGERLAD